MKGGPTNDNARTIRHKLELPQINLILGNDGPKKDFNLQSDLAQGHGIKGW